MHKHQYKGYGGCDSVCGVDVIHTDTGETLVVLTELPENPGTSVTNMVEEIANQLVADQLASLRTRGLRWVERYPAQRGRAETLDEVTFTLREGRFTEPRWRRLSQPSLNALLISPPPSLL